MLRKLLPLLLALLLALPAATALPEDAVSFTDSAGRTVSVPAGITRVAPSGGMAQMVLFALAPETLVGVATEWPPQAEPFLGESYALPVLGQLYGSADLNLEHLATVDPQIILDIGEPKGSIVEDMDDLQAQVGIPTVHIDAGISTFGDTYRALGTLLGLETRAETLAAYCEKVYARTEAIMADVGEEGKASLLYLLGENGLNVIAKGSYHGEIIDMLADNVAVLEDPSSKGTGNPVDMEQLLLWDPDIIVFAPESAYAQVEGDPLWQEMRAIADGRYVEVPFGPFNWMGFPPSVQRYLGILWLTDLLYPDSTGYDLYTEVANYFDLFYHMKLSREQYDALTASAFFAE